MAFSLSRKSGLFGALAIAGVGGALTLSQCEPKTPDIVEFEETVYQFVTPNNDPLACHFQKTADVNGTTVLEGSAYGFDHYINETQYAEEFGKIMNAAVDAKVGDVLNIPKGFCYGADNMAHQNNVAMMTQAWNPKVGLNYDKGLIMKAVREAASTHTSGASLTLIHNNKKPHMQNAFIDADSPTRALIVNRITSTDVGDYKTKDISFINVTTAPPPPPAAKTGASDGVSPTSYGI